MAKRSRSRVRPEKKGPHGVANRIIKNVALRSEPSGEVPSAWEIAAAQALLERTDIDAVIRLEELDELEAAVRIACMRPIPPQQRYLDEWTMVFEKHRFTEDCMMAIRARKGQLESMNAQSKIKIAAD